MLFALISSFAEYPPSRSLTSFLQVAVLVGAVYMVRRSFRPGA